MEDIRTSGYKTPITIAQAISDITSRKMLLPAIQRRFVWSSEQIERLFDSIMRDYPINSFMFWNVTTEEIKNNNKFYEFLIEYRQFFKEENPYINTTGSNDFIAVIDGQQRLTSIYLGLKGSYAYRMPRLWLKDNEEVLPTRHLYINLNHSIEGDNDLKMQYNFRFLCQNDLAEAKETDDWFLVPEIYKYKELSSLIKYIGSRSWNNMDYALETLTKLRSVVFDKPLINYYQEENQDLDTVLDIFIRTNSGGEPLSFSNLLMSYTTAYWKKDARKEFEALIKSVYGEGFLISSDLILKCCLVLFNENIQFKVKNFDVNTVKRFDDNWSRIRRCFEQAFALLKKWGFNDYSFRAKNAIIPIVYYIYHHHIEDDICNDIRHLEEKKSMRKWLCISLLRGVFGGQPDRVLTGVRKVLKEHLNEQSFPFEEIKEAFAGDNSKSLSLTDDGIEVILKTQKESSACYAILSLLYSHLSFDSIIYHQDHLHPAVAFSNLKEDQFKSKEQFEFFNNKEIWNSILNLQLLDGSTNEQKNDEPLKDWVTDKNINLNSHLIPVGVSLDFMDFESFIEKRKELLVNLIKQIIS